MPVFIFRGYYLTYLLKAVYAFSHGLNPLIANCKRLFDSLILAQHVFSFQLHLVCLWAEPAAVQSRQSDSRKTNYFQALGLVKRCCVRLLSEILTSSQKGGTPVLGVYCTPVIKVRMMHFDVLLISKEIISVI